MKKRFAFNKNYFIAAMLLFIVLVVIAVFVKDKFIRPTVGDFLVVIFIYCFLKSFLNASPLRVGIYVLLFAFAVEIGQYFDLVKLLGLEHSKLARVIIGTRFVWRDLVAYTLGILAVLGFEKYILRKSLLEK